MCLNSEQNLSEIEQSTAELLMTQHVKSGIIFEVAIYGLIIAGRCFVNVLVCNC